MIRQHDPTCAYPDGARARRDIRDNNRRRRAGDADHIVMFRQPEAPVSPLLGILRQVQCIPQSIRWCPAFKNKCEIKNRKRQHTATLISYLMKTIKPPALATSRFLTRWLTRHNL